MTYGDINGGPYVSLETVLYARELGFKPITTPAYSPQSNGMANSVAPHSSLGQMSPKTFRAQQLRTPPGDTDATSSNLCV